MKKFLLVLWLSFSLCNVSFASVKDDLYSVSLGQKELTSQVQSFLEKNHSQIKSKSFSDSKTVFYLKKSDSEYILVETLSKDSKTYLYYLCSSRNFDIKDSLIKKSGIKFNKIGNKSLQAELRDSVIVAKYDMEKEVANKPSKPIYDFSDEAQQKYDTQKQAQAVAPIKVLNAQVNKKQKSFISTQGKPVAQPESKFLPSTAPLKGYIVNVPKGVVLNAALQSTVDSASLQKDDKITAILNSDFRYNGKLIAPSGSIIYGKAASVSHPGHAYTNGALELTFYQILTPKGSQINISTEKITVSQKSKRTVNVAKNVFVGAGLGALTGFLMGDSSYVAKGAVIGATTGSIYAVAHKGENVSVKSGLPLQIKLSQPMKISGYN